MSTISIYEIMFFCLLLFCCSNVTQAKIGTLLKKKKLINFYIFE